MKKKAKDRDFSPGRTAPAGVRPAEPAPGGSVNDASMKE